LFVCVINFFLKNKIIKKQNYCYNLQNGNVNKIYRVNVQSAQKIGQIKYLKQSV